MWTIYYDDFCACFPRKCWENWVEKRKSRTLCSCMLRHVGSVTESGRLSQEYIVYMCIYIQFHYQQLYVTVYFMWCFYVSLTSRIRRTNRLEFFFLLFFRYFQFYFYYNFFHFAPLLTCLTLETWLKRHPKIWRNLRLRRVRIQFMRHQNFCFFHIRIDRRKLRSACRSPIEFHKIFNWFHFVPFNYFLIRKRRCSNIHQNDENKSTFSNNFRIEIQSQNSIYFFFYFCVAITFRDTLSHHIDCLCWRKFVRSLRMHFVFERAIGKLLIICTESESKTGTGTLKGVKWMEITAIFFNAVYTRRVYLFHFCTVCRAERQAIVNINVCYISERRVFHQTNNETKIPTKIPCESCTLHV